MPPTEHIFLIASSLPVRLIAKQNYSKMCAIWENVQYPHITFPHLAKCAISPYNCPLSPLSFHKLGAALSTSLFIYLLTSALSFFYVDNLFLKNYLILYPPYVQCVFHILSYDNYSVFVPLLTRRALQNNSNVSGLLVWAHMANKKPWTLKYYAMISLML